MSKIDLHIYICMFDYSSKFIMSNYPSCTAYEIKKTKQLIMIMILLAISVEFLTYVCIC